MYGNVIYIFEFVDDEAFQKYIRLAFTYMYLCTRFIPLWTAVNLYNIKNEMFIGWLYSKSLNSVHFCPKTTTRYSKPHYLILYQEESQNWSYCQELRYFPISILDRISLDQKVIHIIVNSYCSNTTLFEDLLYVKKNYIQFETSSPIILSLNNHCDNRTVIELNSNFKCSSISFLKIARGLHN